MKCEYCTIKGELRVKKEEADVLEHDIYVCDHCWRLLKNPATALPLLRGHLSLKHRQNTKGKPKQLENFMEMISKWRPVN